MSISIYHNPRCSKSRQTLQLLTDKGLQFEIIEYLTNPPTADTLRHILSMLGMRPGELIRKNEAIYKELGLGADDVTDEQLISAMLAHPILIERPVVVNEDQARIGRPPETVLEIL
ncbi:MAG: arsenate reductase (glutaredoxin) [Gammaproteobacteria bacterium]|nr:arsenate reductase (glutaredoxin) [Gammaproteobacteria bacterium]